MAKIKLSAIVSEMRGKLNGSVFAKNRGGAYVRTKVTPVNPSTAAQTTVRAALTSFSQAWRNLTQAQRDAWNGAVSNFTGTDIFGDIKTPSGINLYNKLNLNLANISEPSLLVPPTPGTVGYLSDLVLSIADGANTMTLAATLNDLTAGQKIVVEATEQLSAGIENANSKFAKIAVLAGTSTSPFNLYAAYEAKFGAPVAGKKIFVRVKAVEIASGVSGLPTSASAIVVA